MNERSIIMYSVDIDRTNRYKNINIFKFVIKLVQASITIFNK